MAELTVSKKYYGCNGTVPGNNNPGSFVFFAHSLSHPRGKRVTFSWGRTIHTGNLVPVEDGVEILKLVTEMDRDQFYYVVDGPERHVACFHSSRNHYETLGRLQSSSAAECVGKGAWLLSGSQFWSIKE